MNVEGWNRFWKSYKFKKITKEYFLFDLFTKFLKSSKDKRCLEVGCIPGNFLIAFKKNFSYKIYGVDYSDKEELFHTNMRYNGIKDYTFFKEDFLSFNPNFKFDVVSSFGFIEHFNNPEPYIKKMIDLLKKDGVLIIGFPNFRRGQYLLHRLLL